ncbi:GH32 C-terminal domain-containing protein [Hymenobacter armeniacus]|uniref:beta-fructofuranosidase n=1 Tax=Hymenobacter armeniacus TaxID=2771358 RepID=A0ABR8JUI3_9BACT|nr:GH32 C-terminal domain-containing protein [Hymenobacter armeniacus]MBD2722765.1 GH32 C-terminal domain-containing protein [Hymenobacter armeniacus]
MTAFLKLLARTTLPVLLATLGAHAQSDTLAHWSFDNVQGKRIVERVSQQAYPSPTFRPALDAVVGARGAAVRTDGYSVWFTGALPTNILSDSLTLTAWLALESYPVKPAAIWAHRDPTTGQGLALSVDEFGRLVAEVSAGSARERFVTTQLLAHNQWQQVTLTMNTQHGRLSLYRNGQLLQVFTFAPGPVGWQPTTVFLGKYPRTERVGDFDTNVLNGVLDDVALLRRPLTATQVAQAYRAPAAAPDLRIPASRFAGDYLRPRYHPSPAANWCNEAHGLVYHNGYYHLFYQRNANGPYWGNLNWGHLRSRDLLAWEELPVALWPTPNSFDQVGIWSGHVVVNNGTPTIVYTGVDGVKAGIGTATPDAPLLNWQKLPQNPLVTGAPASVPNRDFRDPYVFRDGNGWKMLVGSGLASPADAGTAFLYQSADLVSWQFVGQLFTGDPALDNSGIFWEMPVFWDFGTKRLLLVNKVPQGSNPARALYWLGDFANNQFTPDQQYTRNLDVVNALLSPAVNTDAAGNVTAIGVIPDQVPGTKAYTNGYAHVFGLPRTWTLQNGALYQAPHPNLTQLRGAATSFSNVNLTATGRNFLGTVSGWQLELRATVQPGATTQQVGFVLGKSASGNEQTRISYDYQTRQVVVDRSASSTNPNTPYDVITEFLDLPTGQPAEWRIFIDGSAVEVFINGRYAFATRMYPASANSNAVDMFVRGGNATLTSAQVWALNIPAVVSSTQPAKAAESQLDTFPNPTTGTVLLATQARRAGQLRGEVLGLDGRVHHRFALPVAAGSSTTALQLPSQLAAGLYVLRYRFDGGATQTRKIMLNR